MNFIEAFLLALALCVDSLVVSAATALSQPLSRARRLTMAAVFGFCQAAFPLAGALVGEAASGFMAAASPWISFALLLFIGGEMVVAAIRGGGGEAKRVQQSARWLLSCFMLGAATSIDAFAVGISLGLQETMPTVLWVVALIGAVTFLVAMLGAWLGSRRIPVPQRWATMGAGVVLIFLGVKILIELAG